MVSISETKGKRAGAVRSLIEKPVKKLRRGKEAIPILLWLVKEKN